MQPHNFFTIFLEHDLPSGHILSAKLNMSHEKLEIACIQQLEIFLTILVLVIMNLHCWAFLLPEWYVLYMCSCIFYTGYIEYTCSCPLF